MNQHGNGAKLLKVSMSTYCRRYYSSPTVIRRVFEIGSGSIKAQVAEIKNELSNNGQVSSQILNTLYTNNVQVLSQAGLLREKRIPEDVVNEGHEALSRIMRETNGLNVQQTVGVATQAYRAASNGKEVLKRFQHSLGFDCSILSSEEEGRLGFEGGRAFLPQSMQQDKNLRVWDCGAGSFQISSLEKIHSDGYGSGVVHRMAEDILKLEKATEVKSQVAGNFNTLRQQLLNKLERSLLPIPPWVEMVIDYSNSKQKVTEVVAIGSENSIFNQQRILGGNAKFSIKDVENLIEEISLLSSKDQLWMFEKERASLHDFSCSSSYKPSLENADYIIPKLCLLLTVMKKAKFEKVHYYPTLGNCAALLTSNTLWPSNTEESKFNSYHTPPGAPVLSSKVENTTTTNTKPAIATISDPISSETSTSGEMFKEFKEDDSLITVNWHLEKTCNYKCVFCYAHFDEAKGNLEYADGLKLLSQLSEAGVYKVNFAGGEPFLNKHLGDYIKYAKSLGLKTSIITNATRMQATWLASYGEYVDQIGISCDSLSDDVNKEIGRGFGQHVQVTKRALQRVHALNNEKDSNIKVKLNTVVMRNNLHEDWSEFIVENGVKRWKIFKILKIEGENEKHYDKLAITDEEFATFVERHRHLEKIDGFVMAPENNDEMTESYIMITPDGKFYQNTDGKYKRSHPILEVGVFDALDQAGFDYTKFQLRGGAYVL